MRRPATVAALRGLIEAVLLAGLGAAATFISDLTVGDLAPWAPLALYGIRQAEGFVDEAVDPTVDRRERGA